MMAAAGGTWAKSGSKAKGRTFVPLTAVFRIGQKHGMTTGEARRAIQGGQLEQEAQQAVDQWRTNLSRPRSFPVRTTSEPAIVQPRSLNTSDWKTSTEYEVIVDRKPLPSRPDDAFLRDELRKQGYDALPHVVSRQELDRAIADGEIEVLRGVDGGRNHSDRFRSGDLFAGRGVFGNGTYTVALNASRNEAVGFAERYATPRDGTSPSEGGIMRMSIRKEARIVDYADVLKDMQAFHDQAIKTIKADYKKQITRESDPVRKKQLKSHQNRDEYIIKAMVADPGTYLTWKGSADILRVPPSAHAGKIVDGGANDYYVILNRSAVRVQQEDGP